MARSFWSRWWTMSWSLLAVWQSVGIIGMVTGFSPAHQLPKVTLRTSTVRLLATPGNPQQEKKTSIEAEAAIPTTAPSCPSSSMAMDPLMSRILLLEEDEEDSQHRLDTSTILYASDGLSVWRSTLLKGRLPVVADFGEDQTTSYIWPPEPLFAPITQAMAELQFPRFVLRHPEIVSTVLWTLWRMTKRYAKEYHKLVVQEEVDEEEEEDDDDFDWDMLEDRWTNYDDVEEEEEALDDLSEKRDDMVASLTDEAKEELAINIVAEELTQSWSGVIGGLQALDQLFGMGHGLLDAESGMDDNDNDEDIVGFGWNDGIWQHSGWRLVAELQREISSMPELRDLIQQLGRRPTAEQSNAMHKFVPRRLDDQGALGALYDPTRRTSIRGITLSGSLSEMLPSEAMLLVQRKQQNNNNNLNSDQLQDDTTSSTKTPATKSSALRRLFLAKMVESKLLSYESSGWEDVPSSNVPKPRHLTRLPSAPGGPILICLDTSWSMMGRREQLSKAVVLACVTAAHQQKREVRIVAFSSARNVMETGPISADAAGVQRLLEFLSSSFGGGTDVTGALKHAMTTITPTTTSSRLNAASDNDDDGHNISQEEGNTVKSQNYSRGRVGIGRTSDINNMAAADILLVTDGEIPDPPVSDEIMQALERLKQRAGVQVHGLLVGKRESILLAKLCTHIHDFLIGYDAPIPATSLASGKAFSPRSRMALQSVAPGRDTRYYWKGTPVWGTRSTFLSRIGAFGSRHSNVFSVLHARFPDDDNDDWSGGGRRRKRGGGKKRRYDDYFENDSSLDYDMGGADQMTRTSEESEQATSNSAEASQDFVVQVEEATKEMREVAAVTIKDESWQVDNLDLEKNMEHSCWRYRSDLQKAVERVAEGLVEREEEARLVVLGMVSREHVLFLGPPGTAKSVLGRRLSRLCGGAFFQRLLTRFTTPEEIFGPLSLRALENDEYRRKTDGFLPTATVAFLDEIFKANSAILNTLLTVLNERQFDNGAGVREDCPIRCVVGASNELPETDELDALYDRFLLRKEVLPVSDDGMVKMLGMTLPGISPCDEDATQSLNVCDTVFTDNLDDLIRSISIAADRVIMGDDACALMRDLRNHMRDLDVEVSDRRLVKATRLLKVSAACHGRARVDAIDCLLLQHIIWRLPEQRSSVREWLWNHVTPGSGGLGSTPLEDESLESAANTSVRQFRLLLDGVRQEAISAVRKTSGDVTGEGGGRKADIDLIRSIEVEASRIAEALKQRSDELARHSELLRRSKDHLWLDPDEAQAAKQLLLPRAEAYLKAVDRALEDARSLELALSIEHALVNKKRVAVLDALWDEDGDAGVAFSEEALGMNMKEAKAKYDTETFRKWKRARKKVEK